MEEGPGISMLSPILGYQKNYAIAKCIISKEKRIARISFIPHSSTRPCNEVWLRRRHRARRIALRRGSISEPGNQQPVFR